MEPEGEGTRRPPMSHNGVTTATETERQTLPSAQLATCNLQLGGQGSGSGTGGHETWDGDSERATGATD
eukprot:scaffold94369_cov31-Tisochrysis_lutea.AAC.1